MPPSCNPSPSKTWDCSGCRDSCKACAHQTAGVVRLFLPPQMAPQYRELLLQVVLPFDGILVIVREHFLVDIHVLLEGHPESRLGCGLRSLQRIEVLELAVLIDEQVLDCLKCADDSVPYAFPRHDPLCLGLRAPFLETEVALPTFMSKV